MEANVIALIAFGEANAAAVAGVQSLRAIQLLQMHPRVRVYLDDSAASKLARSDYY